MCLSQFLKIHIDVKVPEDSLAWEEVQWSPISVWVRGTEYILARAQFFTPQVDEMDE